MQVSDYEILTNEILIYKHEFQMTKLLPAKSHNPYQSIQGTQRSWVSGTTTQKPFFIRPLTPPYLLQTFSCL